jgi:hypothetical protein
MAGTVYTKAKVAFLKSTIADVSSGGTTVKVSLHTASYTPNYDTHEFFSDLTNEVTGTGYSAGGKALTTKAVTLDATGHYGIFGADNVSWTSATISNIRYAAVYVDTGSPSTSPLLCLIDFGGNQSISSGSFTIDWALLDTYAAILYL